MFRALFTAATGMETQQLEIDNISNNLANVNTSGFKKSRTSFEDLMYQTVMLPGRQTNTGIRAPVGLQVGHGSRAVAVEKIYTQGSIKQTGQDLDIAIEGNGFFQIRTPTGDIAYTRSGAFRRDADGNVVTIAGYRLQPPINVPQDAVKINVGEDGTMTMLSASTNTEVELGKLEIANFVNPAGLRNMGKNLYAMTEASGQPIIGFPGEDGRGTLAQGFMEMANVNIAEELINMIMAQRAYEINSKVIQTADQMIQNSNVLR